MREAKEGAMIQFLRISGLARDGAPFIDDDVLACTRAEYPMYIFSLAVL